MKHTFVAMVEIQTDDPRLSIEALGMLGSVQSIAVTRAAVLEVIPRDVTRLVAVLPVEQARMLMMLHEAVGKDLGAKGFLRPPPGYVPPTNG